MGISDLKASLQKTIQLSEDNAFLSWLSSSVELYQSQDELLQKLPSEVVNSIHIGLKQTEKEQFISHEESESRVSKWLEEK